MAAIRRFRRAARPGRDVKLSVLCTVFWELFGTEFSPHDRHRLRNPIRQNIGPLSGFRAGIEGRIHALRRDYRLKRCRYHGERGMGRWVGWGIVAHNLSKVANAGAARG